MTIQQRDLQTRLVSNPFDHGVDTLGIEDAAPALLAAEEASDLSNSLPAGLYRITQDTTLAGKWTLLPGAILSPDPDVTLHFETAPKCSLLENHFDISLGGHFTFQKALPAYSPQLFGALADGEADDTAAVQAAVDAVVARGGGVVYFPMGVYRISAPILITGPNVLFKGTGKRNTQGPFNTMPEDPESTPSTLYFDGETASIKLSHAYDINGFSSRGVTYWTQHLEENRATRCFDFDLGGEGSFRRDFIFSNIAVTGFVKAFDLRASSTSSGASERSMGVLRISYCSLQHNEHVVYTGLDGSNVLQWNGFDFIGNEATQNGWSPGMGCVNVRAHKVNILNNVLEGQIDPVVINTGGYRAISIRGNYFEGNWGTACILVNEARKFDIGENIFLGMQTTNPALLSSYLQHKVLLQRCGDGVCRDPYWALECARVPLWDTRSRDNAETNLNNLVETAWVRYDSPSNDQLILPARIQTGSYTDTPVAPPFKLGPWCGDDLYMVTHAATGDGSPITRGPYNFSPSIPAGYRIVWTWAFRLLEAPTFAPYAGLRYRNASSGVYAQEELPMDIVPIYWKYGDWVVATVAVFAPYDVDQLEFYFWPYGHAGAFGLDADIIYPTVYHVEDINDIRPWVDLSARRIT